MLIHVGVGGFSTLLVSEITQTFKTASKELCEVRDDLRDSGIKHEERIFHSNLNFPLSKKKNELNPGK